VHAIKKVLEKTPARKITPRGRLFNVFEKPAFKNLLSGERGAKAVNRLARLDLRHAKVVE
jgi:hypothetical protein